MAEINSRRPISVNRAFERIASQIRLRKLVAYDQTRIRSSVAGDKLFVDYAGTKIGIVDSAVALVNV
jgi:hypothetical protein